MVQQNIDALSPRSSDFDPAPQSAGSLGPAQRRALSLQALRRTEPVTRLAARHEVSRKFVYQQLQKATTAIDQAFEAPPASEDEVLFRLPVTKSWLEQLVLGLALYCHSPLRGMMELLDALFDYREISLGSLSNLLHRAIDKARQYHHAEDLSAIRVGAHDEIYQAGQPVLVGMDVVSTYCYLLQAVDHCDETTWGVLLLDLQARGLQVDYTIADAGQALRAGQKAAWGEVPCHGDIFHPERSLHEER